MVNTQLLSSNEILWNSIGEINKLVFGVVPVIVFTVGHFLIFQFVQWESQNSCYTA